MPNGRIIPAMKSLVLLPCACLLLALQVLAQAQSPLPEILPGRWTPERAQAYYDDLGGFVSGSNFNPSTSINQLEMWQADDFDPATIDRELGYAEDIGFDMMRVYLHYLPWEQDAAGFKARIDRYLEIADGHGIKTMFVLFDDCWYGNAQLGPQPDPVPGFHNSYWLQCPRYHEVFDTTRWGVLEAYTRDILRTYSGDERVAIWDLYNEPGNNHKPYQIMPLLREVVRWARETDPDQPLTMGAWVHHRDLTTEMAGLMNFMLFNSDLLTIHQYGSFEDFRQRHADYASFGRPLIVTEYLARGNGNNFASHLPYMREHGIGAINWGLVTGKTQTMYSWGSPKDAPEPAVWHHDIFRADGTPFDAAELTVIRRATGAD